LPNHLLRKYFGILLAILTLLFVLRVLGQVLVAYFDVRFLPAMEHWYSGLLPYPILLPVQIVMIVVMFKIITDVVRGMGWFSTARRRTGVVLKVFSYLYFLSMVVRYWFTMSRHPELRWFGHTIPIWFHMILAVFVYVYGLYHTTFSFARKKGSGS
jgi:hypothetical protein